MVRPPLPTLNGRSLEECVCGLDDSHFPPYDPQRGAMSYPRRYEAIKTALQPVHMAVEKGALLASAMEWRKALQEKILNNSYTDDEKAALLAELIDSDPIIYLNAHGPGHIDTVIHRISDVLRAHPNLRLTAYEGFLLLCAVQLHDTGNVFGRAEHERKVRTFLENECRAFLPDAFERHTIERIAMVHGGAYDGNRDTISLLTRRRTLNNEPVRKQLLAALLRLGDELADDYTRADRAGLERHLIPEECVIFHQYSNALHSALVTPAADGSSYIELCFDFGSSLALQPLKKFGAEKYLLDEIYDRTLKAERERRYCMRFLSPFAPITATKVEIFINNDSEPLRYDRITYTLEETGYPVSPPTEIKIVDPKIRCGLEERDYLIQEWGLSI